MDNRPFRQILLLFIISILVLTSSVFAWLSLSRVNNISGIGSNIPDYSNLIAFNVIRKSDETLYEINSIETMMDVFGETKPGEAYTFIIDVNNKTSKEIRVNISLRDIKTLFGETDINNTFNLLRVFYINDGLVQAKYSKNNFSETVNHLLPINDNTIAYDLLADNKKLNDYRLDNLVNDFGDITIYPNNNEDNNVIQSGESVQITFTLTYFETSDIRYQENSLSIAGIYVLGQ